MILTAASVGGLYCDSGAAVISINYDTATSSTPAMAPQNIAGAVPASNWNNVVNNNHSITFGDDSGIATSLGVGVSTSGLDSWNRGADPIGGRIFSDKITMGAIGTINLTNVPYASYELYVYLSDWGSEVITFSLDGGSTTAATLTNTNTGRDSGWNGIYIENDNYVKLTGLSGNSSIRMARTSGDVHLAAFQIVQVPEPQAALLGALGLLTMLRRKRC